MKHISFPFFSFHQMHNNPCVLLVYSLEKNVLLRASNGNIIFYLLDVIRSKYFIPCNSCSISFHCVASPFSSSYALWYNRVRGKFITARKFRARRGLVMTRDYCLCMFILSMSSYLSNTDVYIWMKQMCLYVNWILQNCNSKLDTTHFFT